MTVYTCPTCDITWTNNPLWTPTYEGRVYNGGTRECEDCKKAKS